MKSMYKHWGLYISTDTYCLEVVLGSFWAIWMGLLLSLELKLRSWWFLRYWQFNKQYHGGYQLICLISWPILITSRHDWYQSKGLFKGFREPLRPWELSKNWWRYGQIKFVTQLITAYCLKYRIEGITPHDTDGRSQEWWKCNTWTINKPLIDPGPQNLLSDCKGTAYGSLDNQVWVSMI